MVSGDDGGAYWVVALDTLFPGGLSKGIISARSDLTLDIDIPRNTLPAQFAVWIQG